jgi:hypothetical protein
MKIVVQRHAYGPRSTMGDMFIDDQFECFTLEPSKDTPVHAGHPCIPEGTYPVHLTMSPHMHYVTPEIMDVPGRTYIRIHIANKPEEVLGCTAVGETQAQDWVGGSKDAFHKMMTLLQFAWDRGEQITAEYRGPQ